MSLAAATSAAACFHPAVPIPSAATPVSSAWPPFSEGFAALAEDFYHIEWTGDGYPGQRRADGTFWEHPILPTYVLKDWITQYERNPSTELRLAIGHVANASIARMEKHEGALVFWYEPGGGARLTQRHYSALTQGYYAIWLWQAGNVTGNAAHQETAAKAFRSLLVPIDKHGVLAADYSLAEVPQIPNSYILNGWLSALASAWTYYELSGDEDARTLVLKSSERLAALLPLFDAPAVKNSRYGLTGFVFVRITGDIKDPVQLVGNETLPLQFDPEGPRWTPHQRLGRLNLVVSLAADNRLIADASEVDDVQIQIGDYVPTVSSPSNLRWVNLEWTLADGRLTVDVPHDLVQKIVYPTNFLKVIDGRNTNVYHSIHVRRLYELANATGISELGTWANRWHEAMCAWGDMELYDGLWTRTVASGIVPVADACAQARRTPLSAVHSRAKRFFPARGDIGYAPDAARRAGSRCSAK